MHTSRGSIVVASLDRGLHNGQQDDLVALGTEVVLDGPVEGVLGGLGLVNGKDNGLLLGAHNEIEKFRSLLPAKLES